MLVTIFSLFVISASAHEARPAECTNPLLPCQFVQYDKNKHECPPTKPHVHGSCGHSGLYCDYDNESVRFRCWNGKWQILYSRYCTLNGQQVANGFVWLNENGCVAAECQAGRVQFNDCTKGCDYWGRYLTPGYTETDKNFQNKNRENNPRKYTTYRCDYANHFTMFTDKGCAKDGVNYEDGFIMAEHKNQGIPGSQHRGITLLWACRDGQIRFLGGPGAHKFPTGTANVGYKQHSTSTHAGQLGSSDLGNKVPRTIYVDPNPELGSSDLGNKVPRTIYVDPNPELGEAPREVNYLSEEPELGGGLQWGGCPGAFYPGGTGCPDPLEYVTCCITHWHPECDVNCAKKTCEQAHGIWVPFDNYNVHPYTCEMPKTRRLEGDLDN